MPDTSLIRPTVAVLIPCYNEEVAVGQVVHGFRAALPDAAIYVYDNNSRDRTCEVARAAGAIVRTEPQQGKGHVIRRMFADIDADYYVLVDGDATYEAEAAGALMDLMRRTGSDMVNAVRVTDRDAAYRRGHVLGNRVLTGLVTMIFGKRLSDMLSGYRIFSRRYVKSFPAMSTGFETETELTVHALQLHMPMAEMPTRYVERQPGSVSALRTYHDGIRILAFIIRLVKQERPMLFFCIVAGVLLMLGLAFGIPVVADFMRMGSVPRLPTAVLATGFVLLSAMSVTCGLILDTVALARLEAKRLAYLALPPPLRLD